MAFLAKAQQQAERVLTYAAGGGSAALVDLEAGITELSVGRVDPAFQSLATRRLRNSTATLLAITPTIIAGRVGARLALIVWLAADVPASAVCSDRVSKACAVLARMLLSTGTPPNDPSGNEPEGAPAEVFDVLPPDRK